MKQNRSRHRPNFGQGLHPQFRNGTNLLETSKPSCVVCSSRGNIYWQEILSLFLSRIDEPNKSNKQRPTIMPSWQRKHAINMAAPTHTDTATPARQLVKAAAGRWRRGDRRTAGRHRRPGSPTAIDTAHGRDSGSPAGDVHDEEDGDVPPFPTDPRLAWLIR